jgi:hypothetical protein
MRFADECGRHVAALMAVSEESSQFQFQARALAIAEMWLTLAAVDEARSGNAKVHSLALPEAEERSATAVQPISEPPEAASDRFRGLV